MQEIELKFLVPDAKIDAIKRQTHVKSAVTETLAAHYFDTPEQHLAKAGMALRIRQEGDEWVQTLKMNGNGLTSRTEFNNVQDSQQIKQALATDSLLPDLSPYAEQADLPINDKRIQQQLTRQYITDVSRTKRLIKQDGNVVEVAFDIGKVIHGTDSNNQQSLQEIEFELIEGDMAFLFNTAKTWCRRYTLCLSTVTKAERGSMLLTGQKHGNATKADLSALQVDKNMSQGAFMRAVVHHCLLQILPNASAIVAGSQDGNHVHQLRVGIRRLRIALKFFDGFSRQLNPDWALVLKQTFSLLGEYRDCDVLQNKTQPMLETQGSPKVDWQIDIKVMPIDAVRANDFQLTLLDLMEFALSDDKDDTQKPAKAKLSKIMTKLFGKITNASERFADLDVEAQHDVRKQLKSLRYISEFTAPMYQAKKSKKFLRHLEPAQDVLGEYNDNMVGYDFYQHKASTDPNAYFAVGWFYAQRQQAAKVCANALKTVKDAPKFWD